MEEGRYLGVAGGRRDCGVLLGVCLGGISGVCLSFTGCTAIFHKLWKIAVQEIGSQLGEQFCKTRDVASNLQQAVAQLVLVLRGIYADCRQVLS